MRLRSTGMPADRHVDRAAAGQDADADCQVVALDRRSARRRTSAVCGRQRCAQPAAARWCPCRDRCTIPARGSSASDGVRGAADRSSRAAGLPAPGCTTRPGRLVDDEAMRVVLVRQRRARWARASRTDTGSTCGSRPDALAARRRRRGALSRRRPPIAPRQQPVLEPAARILRKHLRQRLVQPQTGRIRRGRVGRRFRGCATMACFVSERILREMTMTDRMATIRADSPLVGCARHLAGRRRSRRTSGHTLANGHCLGRLPSRRREIAPARSPNSHEASSAEVRRTSPTSYEDGAASTRPKTIRHGIQIFERLQARYPVDRPGGKFRSN